MMLYPVFFKLEGRCVSLVGGGKLAAEKLRGLNGTGASIRVISPELSDETRYWIEKLNCRWIAAKFEACMLSGSCLVIAATDDEFVNREVQTAAQNRNIPVNVADSNNLCDWYNGSVISRGDFQLAFSSNGKSPAYLSWMREQLDLLIPEDENEFVATLGDIREKMKVFGLSSSQRSAWFREKFDELQKML